MTCQIEDDCIQEVEDQARAAARRARFNATRPPNRTYAPSRPPATTTTTSSTTTSRPAPPPSQQYVEEDHDQGFFQALAYNGALQAVTAMFGELYRSVIEVPRLSYRSVWNRRKPPPPEDPRR